MPESIARQNFEPLMMLYSRRLPDHSGPREQRRSSLSSGLKMPTGPRQCRSPTQNERPIAKLGTTRPTSKKNRRTDRRSTANMSCFPSRPYRSQRESAARGGVVWKNQPRSRDTHIFNRAPGRCTTNDGKVLIRHLHVITLTLFTRTGLLE
jgi:hypothetical protein